MPRVPSARQMELVRLVADELRARQFPAPDHYALVLVLHGTAEATQRLAVVMYDVLTRAQARQQDMAAMDVAWSTTQAAA